MHINRLMFIINLYPSILSITPLLLMERKNGTRCSPDKFKSAYVLFVYTFSMLNHIFKKIILCTRIIDVHISSVNFSNKHFFIKSFDVLSNIYTWKLDSALRHCYLLLLLKICFIVVIIILVFLLQYIRLIRPFNTVVGMTMFCI